jgi:hypothetical protein
MPRLAGLQKSIESVIQVGKNPSQKIESTGEIDFGHVSADGTIVVVSNKSKLVLISRPLRRDGLIVWDCSLFPASTRESEMLQDCGKKFR